MLSRRNVRVKVMQVLYALNRDQPTGDVLKSALQHYSSMVADSYNLYLFNLLAFMRVAAYAQQDKIRRQGKLRPTDADTNFSDKLASNSLMLSLHKNFLLTTALGRAKTGQQLDADLIRNLYVEFAKDEEYKKYVYESEETTEKEHIAIYLALYKFLINNETFISMAEDHFPLWADDKSLVVGAMKKTIKALPADPDFLDKYLPQEETIKQFGEQLLSKVLDSDEELLGVIEPSLNNWDADRVAILDMIILKMALSEFLYFASIPTKVTLNEFVDISKLYSTDKSKDFVNGILDRLLKKLTEDGLISKQGRGLKD
ncbi:MAG: transcription antitermination protein NusB [Bacteroidota bacterium]